MSELHNVRDRVLSGGAVDRPTALWLYDQPLDGLCACADEIRRHFCGNGFDLCTIVNAQSGHCPENCKFCAQSAHNHTGADEYPLLSADEIVAHAKENARQGVLRYSIVTSGRRLSDGEVDQVCAAVRRIRAETPLAVCISGGLLNQAQFARLKDAGVTRVHNNLEASRRFFPFVCTTHTFDDKVAAIHAAQAAGLTVCSGGIMGLGETPADRIDMALTLRELGVKSVPVNLLNPIPGTPFANNPRLTADDLRRIVAVYRFILPDAAIRLAGGRGLLPDKGRSCFLSGANAAISGDMLTTAGITTATDRSLLAELGYEVKFDG
nr:biotin synthase BioB [uncultured Agathobaculum sp.]